MIIFTVYFAWETCILYAVMLKYSKERGEIMLIDFHVHMFPEAIAEKTLAMLLKNMRETYNIDQSLSYGGTMPELLCDMEKTGVDISVIQPIATKPTQHKSINDFALSVRSERIISFGSLHPYGDNIDYELCDLKEKGFVGIKLHPDYQGVDADDEKFIDLVKKATEMGMYVTVHSGHDTGIVPPFGGAVDKIIRLLNKVDESCVILAHMGAFNQWDEVEKYLIKSKAYFDISVVSRFMDIGQYRRIIENHGSDRILFGSDSPWESPKDTLEFLIKSGITGDDLERITHINAEKILGIKK